MRPRRPTDRVRAARPRSRARTAGGPRSSPRQAEVLRRGERRDRLARKRSEPEPLVRVRVGRLGVILGLVGGAVSLPRSRLRALEGLGGSQQPDHDAGERRMQPRDWYVASQERAARADEGGPSLGLRTWRRSISSEHRARPAARRRTIRTRVEERDTRIAPMSSTIASVRMNGSTRPGLARRRAPARPARTRCPSPSGCPSRGAARARVPDRDVDERRHDHPADRGDHGRRAARRSCNSPVWNSRLISRPTTRKNSAINPSFTQCRRSSPMAHVPRRSSAGVLQNPS